MASVVVGMVAASIAPFLVGTMSVQIGATFDFTARDIALGVACYYLTSAVISPFGGRLVGRLGTELALRLACAGCTLGLVVAATAVSASGVVLALALLGLPNSLVQPASNQVLASVTSVRRQGLSFGLVQSAIPVATLLSGVLLGIFGQGASWRTAFWLVAALTVVGQFVITKGPTAAGPSRRGKPEQGPDDAPVGGRTFMVALVAGGLLASLAAATLPAFVAVTGQGSGLGPAAVATAQVVGSLACIVARVSFTWRGAVLGGPRLLSGVTCLLLFGAGGYLLLGTGTAWVFGLGAVLAYACGWGWNGIFNLSLTRARPGRIAASTGLAQAGIFGGGVLGPLAFVAVGRNGGYTSAWSFMALVAVAAAVLVGFAGHRWSRDKACSERREMNGR
ncbi:MFS transporter [Micromonospora craniellae]|nr:MFS transporter [Micromonospora craniellae]